MKRLIVLLATLLLSFGLAFGAGNGTMDVRVAGDTVNAGTANQFDFWISNDAVCGGFQIPFEVTSTDGATWTWSTQAVGWGTGKYVTNNPAGRIALPTSVNANFDLTAGLLINETALPAKILIGAGVMFGPGMAAGPLEWEMSAHFLAGDMTVEDGVRHMCINVQSFVGPATFGFSDYGGLELAMTFLGDGAGDGIWCFPVRKAPNFCPVPAGPAAITGPHCGVATGNFTATDQEGNTPIWSVEVVSGTGTASITAGGVLTYDFGADEMNGAVAQLTVGVSDDFHGGVPCNTLTVMVNATDVAPTVACGSAAHTIPILQAFEKSDIVGGDIDVCDDIVYSIVGPGVIDPATGVYTWTPGSGDVGTYTVVVTVTDGALTGECSFTLNVVSFTGLQVIIEKTHQTLQGHYADVLVSFGEATNDVGGFDLLIGYDASALSFTGAELAQDLVDCGWEYFTYRYNWNGNCGNGCPSGLLRIVGLAETNNGPSHPDDACLSDLAGKDIAILTFLVSNDRTLECQYLPIRFYWMDCADNTMSDLTGDTLYMARDIFNFDDNPLDPTQAINYGLNVTEDGAFWPGYYGWAVECWPVLGPDVKQFPLEYIDFIDGGIDVACADSIDARGDINLNGLANEIADAVMFTNYFIQGISAFGAYPEGSIAASDVNADGLALSVADLVYLIRVIVGDAQPYAKPAPGSSFAVTTQVLDGQMAVNYNATSEVGAVLLTFNGPVGTPVLGSGAQNMDMVYNETRVLVYNIGRNAIAAGSNELLTVPSPVMLNW